MALMALMGLMRISGPPLPEIERHSLTDDELFSALEMTTPAMAEVAASYRNGDIAGAKATLARHFRTRTQPRWFIDHLGPVGNSPEPYGPAETAMRHYFKVRGVGYEFGPDIDWMDNPTYAPQYEFDWDWSLTFLRMPWWDDLAAGYRLTGDERYAKEFVAQFLDFRKEHPIPVARTERLRSHPMQYTAPEWRTLEVGMRLRDNWTNAFFTFLRSPNFTDDAVVEMVKAYVEMARYLYRFPTRGELTSNWLVTESTGLFVVGVLLPEFKEAEQWRTEAAARLQEELDRQVYPDGSQWELSPGYGAGVARSFHRSYQLGKLNDRPLPDKFAERLESMYNYLLYCSINGLLPALNDTGRSGLPEAMADAFEDYPQRGDFLWAATGGKYGTVPQQTNYAFPYAGQYVMRSDWGPQARYLIVDAGPYGVAHQHEDNLSFELWAYGDYLITDPGTYRYNDTSPWRQFMLSSLSHNTLVVDYQGQNRAADQATWTASGPAPHVWRAADGTVYFRGTYGSGYGDESRLRVAHTRSAIFVDNRYWVLIDRAKPRDNAEHLYEVLFMLNSEDADVQDGCISTSKASGPNLAIAFAPDSGQEAAVVKGQIEPVRRGWRRGGNTVVPNPTAVVSRKSKGPATFVTLLYPYPQGEERPRVAVSIVEQDDSGIDLVVQLPDGQSRRVVENLKTDSVELPE